MTAGGLVLFFLPYSFTFPYVTMMWVYVSADLPYWEHQTYIKRAHTIQPSLCIICNLVFYHQCTVHSASLHAWNTHADPWDVSASLCNKLVLITCFLLLLLQWLNSHSHSSYNTKDLHLWPYSPWPSCITLGLMVLLLSCPWRDPNTFPMEVSLRYGVLSQHLHFKVL